MTMTLLVLGVSGCSLENVLRAEAWRRKYDDAGAA